MESSDFRLNLQTTPNELAYDNETSETQQVKIAGIMNSDRSASLSTTQRAEQLNKKLQIKTTLNQTYLYDQAKFQREIRAQKEQDQRELEAQQTQAKPKIDKKSQLLAKEQRKASEGNPNVHERLYTVVKKQSEVIPEKSILEKKKLKED